MRLFDNPDTLHDVLGAHRKWQRTLECIAEAPRLRAGAAYSIGDSLTYRRGDGAELGTADLVGRRRYSFVVAGLTGDVRVEVAPKAALTPVQPYSDLTDRELFAGSGEIVTVPQGAVLVVDIDEAARVLPDNPHEAVLLHVSVEGATFHNK